MPLFLICHPLTIRLAFINTVFAAHPQLLMTLIGGFASSISLPHLKHLTFIVGFCISAKKSFINSPAFILTDLGYKIQGFLYEWSDILISVFVEMQTIIEHCPLTELIDRYFTTCIFLEICSVSKIGCIIVNDRRLS